jgi:glucose dehydrogenase
VAGSDGQYSRCSRSRCRPGCEHASRHANHGRAIGHQRRPDILHGTLDYYIRALDNDTGKELWRGRLPVGGQDAPMSYVGRDGKQDVVITVGGATRTGTNDNRGDYVIAYALPGSTK